MQILMRTLTALLFTLLLTVNAQAAPAPEAQEMEQLLVDKGLMAKLDHVRQSVGEKTSELVFTAMGFLGVRYRRGGSTVDSGFDCSGFVRATFEKTVGLLLPRKAEQQAAATEKIDRTDLKPGDLVFFNTMRRAFSHVGIYVGEGKFIHSPKPGSEVRVEDMGIAYWRSRFDGARRVLTSQPETPAAQPSAVTEPAFR